MSRPRGNAQRRVALLEAAVREHQAGRTAAAAEGYRRVLAGNPADVDALHLLGVAQRDLGHVEAARSALERVIALRPGFAEAHGNLGLVLAETGEHAAAIVAYETALALKPALVEPWYNLANSLRETGDVSRALACYAAALERRPFVEGWRNYAGLLANTGHLEEAAEAYRAALALAPSAADLHEALGGVLTRQGRHAEAVACHHRVTCLKPDSAEAHNNLGNALKDFGRPVEAIACYRTALMHAPTLVAAWNNLGNACLAVGQLDAAMTAFRQALILEPGFADAELNLGNALKLRGHLVDAEHCFRQALAHRQDFVQAHNNLGIVLAEQGRHAEAEQHLAQALALAPDFAEAHNNLGNLWKNHGRLADAVTCFERALALRPDYAGAHSNLLFTLNFMDGVTPAEIFARHREFNRRHAAALAPPPGSHTNPRDPERRLRVAYVSPDLRAHACAFFIEPVLRHHDRGAVEVFAYAEVANPDAVTRRLQGLVDTWRSTVGLDDAQVAAQIRADGIDILVDLAGHTANSRLLALARKPAPVQATWLGYPATTGLDVIDYRLTDTITEPPGQSEACYSETLVRLPHSLWCYQPFADMPDVSALPATANGFLTFGSFNSYSKIGPRVVTLWARVLREVPDSRLVMVTVPEGAAQDALRARFSALGVDPGRLVLHDRLPRTQYLERFAQVDLALDPFPCNGGTTTCDALWMGIPVVCLIGDTFLSRASYSLLAACGQTDWAARDDDDYVRICATAAADPAALATTRAGLRARLAASPLLDAAGFARDLEATYRDWWRTWCAASA